jgi:hypothetical protein
MRMLWYKARNWDLMAVILLALGYFLEVLGGLERWPGCGGSSSNDGLPISDCLRGRRPSTDLVPCKISFLALISEIK